jgi:hypothetical protein
MKNLTLASCTGVNCVNHLHLHSLTLWVYVNLHFTFQHVDLDWFFMLHQPLVRVGYIESKFQTSKTHLIVIQNWVKSIIEVSYLKSKLTLLNFRFWANLRFLG